MKLLLSFKNVQITGVEKGNADKNVERPVCAFSFEDMEGNKIKVLLKGTVAKLAWEHYLKDRNSENASVTLDDGTILDKYVTASFYGKIREERAKEIVLDDIKDLTFNFRYIILAD